MIDEIEAKFNQDTIKLLQELKLEEIANKNSEYKIDFRLRDDSGLPTIENQRRIIKMLSDQKLLSSTPYYHSEMGLNDYYKFSGLLPVGYYISIKQPKFDEFYNEKINNKQIQKTNPLSTEDNSTTYFLEKKSGKLILNNMYKISVQNFNSENDNFIEYVLKNPNKKLMRADFPNIKKTFNAILDNLKIVGEVRKLFFRVGKNSIEFRNYVKGEDFENIGINTEKLKLEISQFKTL